MLSEQVNRFSHKDQHRTVVHLFVVDMLLFLLVQLLACKMFADFIGDVLCDAEIKSSVYV